MGAFKRKYKTREGKEVEAENWTVEFYIDGQRYCKTIEGTGDLKKKDADKLCDALRDKKKNEIYGSTKTTFDDAMLAFYTDYCTKLDARRKLSPHKRIKDSYSGIIQTLIGAFSGKALDAITRADVVEFILKRRRTGAKDKTIKNDILCLSSMFSFAENLGMCDYRDIPNFTSIKKMLAASKPKTRYLSEEDFDKLINIGLDGKALSSLRFFVAFDIETGLRMEELLSLRWMDVDIPAKRITVVNTKNGKDRYVPLSQKAVELLKQQLQQQQQNGNASEFVISSSKGGRYSWFEGTFKRACVKAGVKCSIHDLRRTFGSWRLQGVRGAKLDLKQVSLVLGHSSTAITEKHYAFLKEQEITL